MLALIGIIKFSANFPVAELITPFITVSLAMVSIEVKSVDEVGGEVGNRSGFRKYILPYHTRACQVKSPARAKSGGGG